MTALDAALARPANRQAATGAVLRAARPAEAELRGLASELASAGRHTAYFGRMFPSLPPFVPDVHALELLAQSMLDSVTPASGESKIPAGYTYFAQFVDHDLSFEATSELQQFNDPYTVPNLRTPRLDLDSLYGDGPLLAPFLYEGDGVRLRVGVSSMDDGNPDLPRTAPGEGTPAVALIGDPRNDETIILSQLHLGFIRFHNRVAQVVHDAENLNGAALFERAQRLVRWHYQWVVVHDLLRRIIHPGVLDQLLQHEQRVVWDDSVDGHERRRRPRAVPIPTARHVGFAFAAEPRMPVEFSAAAFRFGHSMVRPFYFLQRAIPFPIFSNDVGDVDLRGFRERPPNTYVDHWSFFFTPPQTGNLQHARKIDTRITAALGAIPAEALGPGAAAGPPVSLPLLDLKRGRSFKLPSGQAVAKAMGLPRDFILQPGDFTELTDQGQPAELAQFARKTPLWYYCLKEAERFADGDYLGPVGGRIVAEVLLGLLQADPTSYLHARPRFEPEERFGATRQVDAKGHATYTFGMPELLAFASPPPAS